MQASACRALAAAGVILLASLLVSPAIVSAQKAETVRIRGQIVEIDGNTLRIKARTGRDVTVRLADKVRVMALVPVKLDTIKPDSYIGITAMPQPDGTQRAVAIHIFPDAMRGTGEGHRPWDREPGSTMTNATVETIVAGVDGRTIRVKYKGGEQAVSVPPDTPIVAMAPGARDELKAGAQIIIMAGQLQPDGTVVAPSINVGRGVAPPM